MQQSSIFDQNSDLQRIKADKGQTGSCTRKPEVVQENQKLFKKPGNVINKKREVFVRNHKSVLPSVGKHNASAKKSRSFRARTSLQMLRPEPVVRRLLSAHLYRAGVCEPSDVEPHHRVCREGSGNVERISLCPYPRIKLISLRYTNSLIMMKHQDVLQNL